MLVVDASAVAAIASAISAGAAAISARTSRQAVTRANAPFVWPAVAIRTVSGSNASRHVLAVRRARGNAWNAGAAPERILIDIDATLIGAHSEKDGATGTFKGGFGFHPLLAYLVESREPPAGVLRPGNAGAN